MSVTVSTAMMIERLSGLLNTSDMNDWEDRFVRSLVERKNAGEVTKLTDKQVEALDRLHSKHFGD